MQSATQTKTVTNTMLAVATAALLIAAGAAFILVPGTPGADPNMLLPIADGNYQGWIPRLGTTYGAGVSSGERYMAVSEPVCDGQSFVYAQTVGDRVSFEVDISAIPEGATINSVTITPCAAGRAIASADPVVMNVFYRYNGDEYHVDSQDMGNYSITNTNFTMLPAVTFTTVTINHATGNTLEIGAVYSSNPSGNPGKLGLSQLSAVVDYSSVPLSPTDLILTLTTVVTETGGSSAANNVNLVWVDNSNNEDGFAIFRDGIQIASVGPNINTYLDVHPPAGAHMYSVRAYNADGNSANDAFASVVVPLFVGTPVVTVVPLTSAPRLANGWNDLLQLQVMAQDGDINLHKFTFDLTTTTARVTEVQLVDVTNSPEVVLYSAMLSGRSGYALIHASMSLNPFISEGQSRTFVLRGLVGGLGTSGASVSTRLMGDEAYPVSGPMGTIAAIEIDRNNDFIWSDRSASGHSDTTGDWGNGYLVTGLTAPSSTPSVIAQ
ncbi:MAG: hypothetical protein AAB408_05500 [Patescibacteria group bacterium]